MESFLGLPLHVWGIKRTQNHGSNDFKHSHQKNCQYHEIEQMENGGLPISERPNYVECRGEEPGEQQIAAARTLVGQDPKRAAQVVKDWVAADG